MSYGDVVTWTCVRAAGLALAMMPVMTGGVALLPMSAVNQGSAWSNVSRQVTGAIGLSALGALASSQQAQMMADRTAFLTGDVLARSGMPPPPLGGGTDLTALYGIYQQLPAQVMGDAYGNIFVVTAVLCGIGAVLALGLPARPAAATPAPAPPARPPADAKPQPAPEPQPVAPTAARPVEQPQPRVVVGPHAR